MNCSIGSRKECVDGSIVVKHCGDMRKRLSLKGCVDDVQESSSTMVLHMLVQLPLGLEGGRAGGAIQLDGTVAIAMPFNQVGKLQSLSTSTLAEEGEQGGIAEGKDNEINEHKTIYFTSGIALSCDASNGHLCLPPCRNCHTLPWPPPCHAS